MKEILRNRQGLTEEEFLEKYDASMFERPSVTVDMLIFTVVNEEEENYRKLPEKALKLLMVKRGDHPFMGQWALPGGFVSMQESVEDAALRELKTETNVDNVYMEQLYTWGDVGRDPRTRVISCSYMALADSAKLNIVAGDDADDAKWFNIRYNITQEKKTITEKGYIAEKQYSINLWNDTYALSTTVKVVEIVEGRVIQTSREVVESNGIAFDHAKIIEYGIERLKNKIEYTDIAFNLMPELFTLSELQQVYEVILGKELLAAAFRRKIADMVVETNQFTKDAGHRPSKLYRFNHSWRTL
ncbi:ADP-ribose pyrophosphatase YjhB (NUDIX family) [Anaerobacterium chartisolvens]|uniref:ADP-ribose pyrophosphatase YjhB (NUDIX family) n=1 Tax=Anaerobacterium chartisolvens TaxID=1297424 RepID=A0A369ASI6_9FIRM|nr:NUDIX domain-containing protein [Anaerobacterium chartisolvens]RCX12065.1 ADP-ribose pyrophosphatase YjhB (NUDIX family) [Anaerobacterium chartisolvens]